MMILMCLGQAVGWIAGLYFDPDLRRLGGHVIIAMVGAECFGYLSLRLISEGDELAMIAIAAVGTAALLYITRFRRTPIRDPVIDEDQRR